jgi:uncharacterized protein YkwD
VRSNGMRTKIRLVLVATLAAAGILALSAPAAIAAASLDATAQFSLSTVTVGNTNLSGTLTFANQNTSPDVGATICDFGDTGPLLTQCDGAEGMVLTPSCGVQFANAICNSPSGDDPGVFSLHPTATGTAGTCSGMAFNVVLVTPPAPGASLGKYRFDPPAGQHVQLANVGDGCTIGFTFDVLKTPTKDIRPAILGMQTAQVVEVTEQSSVGNIGAGQGTSTPTTVLKASPTIATTASAPTVLGAGAMSDQATVTGLVNPVAGATVTFQLYGPSDPSCSSVAVFTNIQTLTLNGASTAGIAQSSVFSPLAAGTYRWIATYSGDANNSPVSGICSEVNETRTVTPSTPTIATVASPAIALGGTLSDQVTVSGLVNPPPNATVSFRLYAPNDANCSGAPVFAQLNAPLTLNPAQTVGTRQSASFAPTTAGTFRWRATYDGDANNTSVAGTCGDATETRVVSPASPSIATVASPDIALGAGALSDQATVSGLVNPIAGDTVTFRLYGPDDATCSGAVAITDVETIALSTANTVATAQSTSFTPTATGVYRWRATYGGDVDNLAATGACDLATETRTVAAAAAPVPPPPPPPPPPPLPPPMPPPGAPRILSARFLSAARVGATTVLQVRAIDPARPIRGLETNVGETRGKTGISACHIPSFGPSVAPVTQRVPISFRRPGTHRVTIVVLSGDCASPAARSTTTTVRVKVAARRPAARPAVAGACADGKLVATAALANQLRVAAAVLCLVNRQRRTHGRTRLLASPGLARIARGHSRDMVKRLYFDHDAPGGPSFRTRFQRIAYRGPVRAENIGYGEDFDAETEVRAWMNSPGHRSNILHPRLRFAGVGVTRGIPLLPRLPGATYTMDFGSTLR